MQYNFHLYLTFLKRFKVLILYCTPFVKLGLSWNEGTSQSYTISLHELRKSVLITHLLYLPNIRLVSARLGVVVMPLQFLKDSGIIDNYSNPSNLSHMSWAYTKLLTSSDHSAIMGVGAVSLQIQRSLIYSSRRFFRIGEYVKSLII